MTAIRTAHAGPLALAAALLAAAIALSAISGCTVSPTAREARETIISYYDQLGYDVVALELGNIQRIPVSDRVFGGSPTYTIEVKSITLADARTRGVADEKTFTGAAVRIREREELRGRTWIVTDVANIPAA